MMDISRKIGVGIAMIIPSFVGGGAVWSLFSSWLAVFCWIVIMVLVYGGILKEKFSRI
ncbi:MAG: hypothetical protein JRJ06_05520 [Deltaproteobacteria bacterium]|nr:hypothetical protein [Deltaproteobacteria bacterium]